MLTQGFQKFYGCITEVTEVTEAPETNFQQNMKEFAAQLLPP